MIMQYSFDKNEKTNNTTMIMISEIVTIVNKQITSVTDLIKRPLSHPRRSNKELPLGILSRVYIEEWRS